MSTAPRFHAPLRQRAPRQRRQRNADVQLIDVVGPDGRVWTVALSRSCPGSGYLLELDGDGRYRCRCQRFAYKGACAHTDAAYARIAAQRASQPQWQEASPRW